MSIRENEKLDDTYNIHILLTKMKAHLVRYDMHDVFTILSVNADGKTLGASTKNLFSSYPMITQKEVAASNKWYATWPEPTYFCENFRLPYQFSGEQYNGTTFENISKIRKIKIKCVWSTNNLAWCLPFPWGDRMSCSDQTISHRPETKDESLLQTASKVTLYVVWVTMIVWVGCS